MAQIDEEIRLGMQSVYDASPIESVNSLSNDEMSSSKGALNRKTSAQAVKGSQEAKCLEMIELFDKEAKGFIDYKDVEARAKATKVVFEDKKNWLIDYIQQVKSDKNIISDSEWANIRSQADMLFETTKITQQKYKSQNVFHTQDKLINDFGKIYLDDSMYDVFREQNLGEAYLDCRNKLNRQLANRDNAERVYNETMQVYDDVVSLFDEFEKERNKQKTRTAETTK